MAREAVWPVGGERQSIERSEKAEVVEHWRRAEAQALTALCETKKVWRRAEVEGARERVEELGKEALWFGLTQLSGLPFVHCSFVYAFGFGQWTTAQLNDIYIYIY